MSILVTGATGKLGVLVVEALLETVPAGELAVSVRDPQKAEALRARGVDVRHGDFDLPETLDRAFAGVQRLLLISTDGDNDTRIRQHAAAVAAAARANVGFIAYTSICNATDNRISLAEVHRATEAAIRESGIAYSFLRNNWYLENELSSIQAAIGGAPWLTSAGEGKIGWALRSDYARAAAAVLAGEDHDHTIYELSGTPANQAELTAVLGSLLGKDVPLAQVSDTAYAEVMKQVGVPEPIIPFLVGLQAAIREDALNVISDDFRKLLGRPAIPLREALDSVVSGLNG